MNSNDMNTLNKEDLVFLKKLGKKMNKQNNCCTQFPLFVIKQKVKRYGDSGWCSEVERLEEIDESLYCQKCLKKYEKGKKLPDYCEECDSECFAHYNWEDEIVENVGCFFTSKEAKEHILLNYYHYHNPFVYGISCWRNYEMQKVLEILSRLGGNGKALSHYK